jgi:hypothetical protein
MSRCCGDCKFSVLREQLGNIGLMCERFPPVPVVLPSLSGPPVVLPLYPQMSATSGCWEFEGALAGDRRDVPPPGSLVYTDREAGKQRDS